MREEIKRFAGVWLALMVLLALTLGSAFLHLGAWNSVAKPAIAVAKAALVVVFFMHLKSERGLIRICAGVALLTLTLLFAVSGTDYATRVIYRTPWQVPQQLQPATIGR